MPPHRVMHLLALGREDRVRDENTVWMCAACFTCGIRCPNEIDIPGVFDELRARWTDRSEACPVPATLSFHRGFVRELKRRGRVHELRLMGEYNLAIRTPFRNIALAWQMFRKGRLRILPPRAVKGFHQWITRQSQK